MRALIVEDSDAVRSILREYMEEIGFDVFEAANGEEGLERLDAIWPVDVVLVDWNMPRMNGGEMVGRLRSRTKYARVPVMVVTTDNRPEHISRALASGANEFLMKPFDQQALVEKLTLMGVEPGSQAA